LNVEDVSGNGLENYLGQTAAKKNQLLNGFNVANCCSI